jgi:tetratricopeptide (TPR) repeat protein
MLLENKESTRNILKTLLDSFSESEDPASAAQQIGRCFLKLREFHSATEWLNRALELAPNDPWTHLYLGNLAHHKDQYDRALVYFLRASQLMPDDPTPFWCIGDIYDAMGKPKEAGEYYRKAHSVDPENAEANIRLDEWYERNYAP